MEMAETEFEIRRIPKPIRALRLRVLILFMRHLRVGNFKELLSTIKSLKLNGGSLLDGGCAHGCFLDIAENDFEVFGLEPDRSTF
jgi:hypothetical protein